MQEARKKNASVDVLINEVESAARFAEHYWKPTDGLPGLVEAQALFQGRDIVDELYSLARAARGLDLERRVPRRPDDQIPRAIEQGKRLVVDLDSACDAVITVERRGPEGDALTKARARRRASSSPLVLAQALRDLVGLAERLKPGLERLGFALTQLDDASAAAELLTSLPGSEVARTRREARTLRDHMLALADERIRELIAVCGYVFRHHPELRKAARRTRFRA
ncbi:MAG: hypothetical protein CSA65_03005 [Proteobacteria bacterium]|nr:MAG: hypothetical protein CSA65_03005 [Pseudomonadota bacterium]